MKIINQLKIVIIIATISVASQAQAATYYVATTGSDSNPGTEASPFRTIAQGSQALSAGDELLIRAGTYSETMLHNTRGFKFTSGTSPSARTRYAAYPGEKVIIKPSFTVPMLLYFAANSAFIEVEGLTFDGTNTTSRGIVGLGYADPLLGTKYLRFINNETFGGYSVAIRGVNNELIGNHIHHSKGYGIYASGNNMLIEGNLVHDTGGYGIHLYKYNVGSLAPNNNVVRNNVFYNNGYEFYHTSNPTVKRQTHTILVRGTNNQIYNNIIYKSYGGIIVGYGATNIFVANNTIYGTDTDGIDISNTFGGSQGAKVINNISFGNGGAQITNTGTGTTLQTNMTTDPLFWNASGADFGLKLLSPAIDAGVTVSEVKKDFIGTPRPVGPTYDIGAFEGSGSRPNPIPASDGSVPDGGSSTDPTCCI